jgi:hypothetical protein
VLASGVVRVCADTEKECIEPICRWISIPFIFHFTRYALEKLAAFIMNGWFQKAELFFPRTNIRHDQINFTISPKNSLGHECLPFYAALTFMCYYSNDFSSACDVHNLW